MATERNWQGPFQPMTASELVAGLIFVALHKSDSIDWAKDWPKAEQDLFDLATGFKS